ncbi:Uncharacterised protein [Salmonella enterica subsp. arizonae]|nr:Uncharacterised protein [Salmonella enterica subsp. arizonae]
MNGELPILSVYSLFGSSAYLQVAHTGNTHFFFLPFAWRAIRRIKPSPSNRLISLLAGLALVISV